MEVKMNSSLWMTEVKMNSSLGMTEVKMNSSLPNRKLRWIIFAKSEVIFANVES